MADDSASTGQSQSRASDPQPDRLGGKPGAASDRAEPNTIENALERDVQYDRTSIQQAIDRIARSLDNADAESALKQMRVSPGFTRDVVFVSHAAIESKQAQQQLEQNNDVLKQLVVVGNANEPAANLHTTTTTKAGANEDIRYTVRANVDRGEFEIRKESVSPATQNIQVERVDGTKDLKDAIDRAEKLTARDKAIQDNKKPDDKDDLNLELRAALMTRLEKRYVRAIGYEGDRYHFRDDLNVVAFEVALSALGKTHLKTDHDDPAVVRSMVDRARIEGWTSIHVKGSEDFRREAWMAATVAGLEVKGYKPKDRDQALLDELQRERAKLGDKYEQQNERSRRTSTPRGQTANEGRVVDESKISKPQETALIALEQTLRERGDSEPQINMAVSMAREQFQQNRVYAGELKEHGRAPYEFNDKNEKSYYVKLEAANGRQDTVWGVHLPEALKQGEAKVGDQVFVAYQGRQPVTIKVPDRDAEGKVTGSHEITTHRNTWAIERFDKLSEQAREKLNNLAGEAAKQPVVRQYDHIAIPKTPTVPPPSQERPSSERQR